MPKTLYIKGEGPKKPPPKKKLKKKVPKTLRIKPKLPNFNRYIDGINDNMEGRKLTSREVKGYRGVYDNELLHRQLEGSWEGGATKAEMEASRKKRPHLQIKGIDY